ncbi:MAG: phosphate ABC transporter permease PstA [Planctomycetota bacterium]
MSSLFGVLCGGAMTLCVVALVGLLATVAWNASEAFLTDEAREMLEEQGVVGQAATRAAGMASTDYWSRAATFMSSTPSRRPRDAGILPAVLGSIWLIVLTALFAVPIGVGAAVYLEEYAANSRWRRLVQLNIANLAGVPSIVYGILGLALFVRTVAVQVGSTELEFGFGLGRVILSGALTLTLVVLPIVILAAQEALRSVPGTIRQASYALGATRWQTVWMQVLPAALPGIMTGVILAVARALGEAAPLVAVGAVGFISRSPTSPLQDFTAMPLQIFQWAGRPQEEFHSLASAAIIVLLTVLIIMNAGAVYVRQRFGSKIRW